MRVVSFKKRLLRKSVSNIRDPIAVTSQTIGAALRPQLLRACTVDNVDVHILIQYKFKFELTKAYTNVRYQINVTNESRSILSNTCTFNRNVCSFYMNTKTKTVK